MLSDIFYLRLVMKSDLSRAFKQELCSYAFLKCVQPLWVSLWAWKNFESTRRTRRLENYTDPERNIHCIYWNYHVKFIRYCILIECSRPIKFNAQWYAIAREVDRTDVISAVDIAFIRETQNGWTLRLCFWGEIKIFDWKERFKKHQENNKMLRF